VVLFVAAGAKNEFLIPAKKPKMFAGRRWVLRQGKLNNQFSYVHSLYIILSWAP